MTIATISENLGLSDDSPIPLKGTKTHKELLSYLDTCFEQARTARIPFEQQWYLNLAFYFGKHYASWVGNRTVTGYAKLVEPAVPPWRVRLVVNKIRSIIRGELSKVTREKPRGYVVPATSEDDDLAGARAADDLLEFLWQTGKINKLLRTVEFWTLILGTGFVKDFYDPNIKDQGGIKGKICAENVTAFHLYAADLRIEDIEDQPHIIHCMAKDPGWVKDTFGVTLTADADTTGSTLEYKFLNAMGIQGTPKKTTVSIKEIWIKPCGRFPDGAMIQWANGEILNVEPKWPLPYTDYPFTKLDHIPTGRFYAASTIEDLISLQKEYNRSRSQIIEAKNRMSKPQLLAARGSVDASKITTEPGLVIFYTPGFTPPVPLQLQNLPSYVFEDMQQTLRDMDDVSSQHEVTKGGVPPGVTAATAISYLQEQDDSKLAPTVASLEEGVEKLGQHFLKLVHTYWTTKRKVTVTGENDQFEAFEFDRSNINGNTDYRVEAGSATPRSLAAKQAFIMELVDKGLIPPDQALKYLDMGETARLYRELQVDTRAAQDENLKMFQGGKDVTTHGWDSHLAHIVAHDNFRKTQKFLGGASAQVRIMFESHVTTHKQTLALQYGQQFAPNDPKLDGFIHQLVANGGVMPIAQPTAPVANSTQGPPQGA